MLASLFPFLTPIAVLLGLGAVALTTYFNGSSSVSASVIAAYKTQVEQLKEQRDQDTRVTLEKMQSFTKQVSELQFKIGEQNGIIKAKDEQIDKLQKIVENRNPELLTLLEQIKEFMMQSHGLMVGIDARTRKSEERDSMVDKGHLIAVTSKEPLKV